MQGPSCIALLTDFGLGDPYVAQMKAVLLATAPTAPLLDISHDVRPQDVAQAAFFLASTLPWLPPGTVVVAVVDPGVGTDRRVLALECASHWVLAPDNGLVSLLLEQRDVQRCLDLTPSWQPASTTFHGRDVFAPLAARLAMGDDPLAFGVVWQGDAPVRLPAMAPRREGDAVNCRVLSVDRFGNIVLNLDTAGYDVFPPQSALLAPKALPLVAAASYAGIPAGQVGILPGSQGYLELAVAGASAARRLDLQPGDRLRLFWPQGDTHDRRA